MIKLILLEAIAERPMGVHIVIILHHYTHGVQHGLLLPDRLIESRQVSAPNLLGCLPAITIHQVTGLVGASHLCSAHLFGAHLIGSKGVCVQSLVAWSFM